MFPCWECKKNSHLQWYWLHYILLFYFSWCLSIRSCSSSSWLGCKESNSVRTIGVTMSNRRQLTLAFGTGTMRSPGSDGKLGSSWRPGVNTQLQMTENTSAWGQDSQTSWIFPHTLFAAAAAAAAKSRQSCPTLCDPIDGSPPGSPVPGILQARTLEWVAISFSNAWKWKVKVKSLSCVRLLATPWTVAYQAPPSMGLSRQEYWSGVPLPSPKMTFSKFYCLFIGLLLFVFLSIFKN